MVLLQQVALVWVCMIADPSDCATYYSNPFLGDAGLVKCREEIIKLAMNVNESLDHTTRILVSSKCELEKGIPVRFINGYKIL